MASRTRGFFCRGNRLGLIQSGWHALRKVRRHRHAVDRHAGQGAKGDRGRVEILASLSHLGARGLEPLFGLLLIGDADRAFGDAFAKIAGEPLVKRHIVLRDGDQPLLEDIVDVGARDVQRDEFGTLLNACRGGIGTRRLAADFRFAPAAVVNQLIDDQVALDRPQRVVCDPKVAPGRVLEACDARGSLNRNVRVIEPLALLELLFGRRAVGNRLANLQGWSRAPIERLRADQPPTPEPR